MRSVGAVLSRLKEYAILHKIPVILDDSLSVLLKTVEAENPARVLEIGTAIGYSGINILQHCDGRLYTVDVDADSLSVARKAFAAAGFSERVTVWEGDAVQIVDMLSGEFDFIFLDGPKGRYAEMLPKLKTLLKKGGVLFADNVLFKGYTFAENPPRKHRAIVRSLRSFIEDLRSDDGFDAVLSDDGDGIIVAEKR